MRRRVIQEQLKSEAGRAALRELARYFAANGYYRGRPARQGTHRGYECRLAARDKEERDVIVDLLKRAGIPAGKPFAKGKQWRIPVYGKEVLSLLQRVLKKPKKK
jgi:hypothetical protein